MAELLPWLAVAQAERKVCPSRAPCQPAHCSHPDRHLGTQNGEQGIQYPECALENSECGINLELNVDPQSPGDGSDHRHFQNELACSW